MKNEAYVIAIVPVSREKNGTRQDLAEALFNGASIIASHYGIFNIDKISGKDLVSVTHGMLSSNFYLYHNYLTDENVGKFLDETSIRHLRFVIAVVPVKYDDGLKYHVRDYMMESLAQGREIISSEREITWGSAVTREQAIRCTKGSLIDGMLWHFRALTKEEVAKMLGVEYDYT